MKNDTSLEQVISAFEELEFEQRTTGDLENARNKKQMMTYIESLDYSLRRLKILEEAVSEMVTQKQQALLKQEKLQTFKTKVINLSREYDLSYQDVLTIMASIRNT